MLCWGSVFTGCDGGGLKRGGAPNGGIGWGGSPGFTNDGGGCITGWYKPLNTFAWAWICACIWAACIWAVCFWTNWG